jgi:hypothetical protein
MLIEAKAGERIDTGKLHFNRIAALFEKGSGIHTTRILAQNIRETRVIKQGRVLCHNPLYSGLPLGGTRTLQ